MGRQLHASHIMALLAPVLAAGCALPPVPQRVEPETLSEVLNAARLDPVAVTLGVAPLAVVVSEEEAGVVAASGKASHAARPDVERVGQMLLEVLAGSGAFARVEMVGDPEIYERVGEGAREVLLDQAWERRLDLVLLPRVRLFEHRFLERNGLYWPNLFLWWMWWVPSWYVRDEEWATAFVIEYDLVMVGRGGAPIESGFARRRLPEGDGVASLQLALDDFERGWDLSGFARIPSSLDDSNWAAVDRTMRPRAEVELARLLAADVLGPGREAAGRGAVAGALGKDLALIVGVSRRADSALAGAPNATADAWTMAGLLTNELGMAPRQVRALTDERASAEAVLAALAEELLGRVGPGDRVMIFIAAAADRDPDGNLQLLMGDASSSDATKGRLGLADLLDRVRRGTALEGREASRVVVVVDARPAVVAGTQVDRADLGVADRAALEAFRTSRAHRSVVLADELSGLGFELEAADRGLVSYFLIDGVVSGRADADADGVVRFGELEEWLARTAGAYAGARGLELRRAAHLTEAADAAVFNVPGRDDTEVP